MELTADARKVIREEVHEAIVPVVKDVQENKDDVEKITETIFGNGSDGMKSDLTVLKTDMIYVKDFIKEVKANVTKGIWLIVALLITQIIDLVMKIPKP